jgi:hypothetical protein
MPCGSERLIRSREGLGGLAETQTSRAQGGTRSRTGIGRRCETRRSELESAQGPSERKKAEVHLRAMAVEFPEVAGHPNRLPFEGILTLIDVASDKAPSGSRGHRVVLTRAAAEAALPSLLGMGVGYKTGWDGHDARQKCGIITAARLEGHRLVVDGFVFARDFPEFATEMNKASGPDLSREGAMGMSYELADAHVEDMRASVWTLTRATFTGAAILLREKAAYRNTSFRLTRSPARRASTKH